MRYLKKKENESTEKDESEAVKARRAESEAGALGRGLQHPRDTRFPGGRGRAAHKPHRERTVQRWGPRNSEVAREVRSRCLCLDAAVREEEGHHPEAGSKEELPYPESIAS